MSNIVIHGFGSGGGGDVEIVTITAVDSTHIAIEFDAPLENNPVVTWTGAYKVHVTDTPSTVLTIHNVSLLTETITLTTSEMLQGEDYTVLVYNFAAI